ncbi:hypothetical protein DFJ77DRAFT_441456 [Powellomyces hirtus]|nr:hypothetical protein DFJ77DRAFT_441456 [Powellomyces hirtus]
MYFPHHSLKNGPNNERKTVLDSRGSVLRFGHVASLVSVQGRKRYEQHPEQTIALDYNQNYALASLGEYVLKVALLHRLFQVEAEEEISTEQTAALPPGKRHRKDDEQPTSSSPGKKPRAEDTGGAGHGRLAINRIFNIATKALQLSNRCMRTVRALVGAVHLDAERTTEGSGLRVAEKNFIDWETAAGYFVDSNYFPPTLRPPAAGSTANPVSIIENLPHAFGNAPWAELALNNNRNGALRYLGDSVLGLAVTAEILSSRSADGRGDQALGADMEIRYV